MTHPTQEDDVKAILDALALGPQAWDYDSNMRPFYNDPEGNSRGGECDGTYTLYGPDFEIDGDTYEGPTLSERCKLSDAKFISAANPARLTRLLARLEQAERDKDAAVLAEREACAKVCEDRVEYDLRFDHVEGSYSANICAQRIRQRAAIASEAKT